MGESSKRASRQQTIYEEIVNSVTHGVGAALSIAGLTALVVFAALKGDAWKITSFSVYGVSLVALYLASTLYHSFQKPRIKDFFRRLDHAAIFLLIAGTYTPFTLVCMRGPWGWTLFGVTWGIAAVGILFKIFCMGKYEPLAVALYVGMGWVGVLALPAMKMIPGYGLVWMAVGGVLYTAGVVFYAWSRLPFHHGVWHLFVLAGSICHFFTITYFVLPHTQG